MLPGMNNTLVPAETPELPPVAAPLPEVPIVVTDAQADEAAKQLGMTKFSAKNAKNLKAIGMFRGQQNVVHLGVGRLAACDHALGRLLEVSVEMAEDSGEDANMRIGALMAGKSIVEVIQNGIKMEAEFQSEKLIGEPARPRRRSFDESDKPIVPVQVNTGGTVNINVDGKKASEDTKSA